jgi:hypothetical protein
VGVGNPYAEENWVEVFAEIIRELRVPGREDDGKKGKFAHAQDVPFRPEVEEIRVPIAEHVLRFRDSLRGTEMESIENPFRASECEHGFCLPFLLPSETPAIGAMPPHPAKAGVTLFYFSLVSNRMSHNDKALLPNSGREPEVVRSTDSRVGSN